MVAGFLVYDPFADELVDMIVWETKGFWFAEQKIVSDASDYGTRKKAPSHHSRQKAYPPRSPARLPKTSKPLVIGY